MNKDKISSQEIIDLVASKASVSKRAAEEFLKVMISSIEDALMEGEVVKIKNFGTFKLQWNEPRKSVNVQTGEEILLSGYHKVTFTPENHLKDLVNEPFAHLEPVLLDEDNEPVMEEKPEDTIPDPLRIFTEQASEIKNLISEIQALSPVSSQPEKLQETEPEEMVSEENDESEAEAEEVVEEKAEPVEDTVPEIPVVEVREVEKEVEKTVVPEANIIPDYNIEHTATTEEPVIAEPVVESNYSKEEIQDKEAENVTEEYIPNPFLKDVPKRKKRRPLRWILIILLFLIACSVGLYYLYPPANNLGNNMINSSAAAIQKAKENISLSEMLNNFTKWIKPDKKADAPVQPEVVVVPKDTTGIDTVKIQEPVVDSLQMLFDNPRVFTKYIATEKIKRGSRLALMSLHYYGASDFWVYIYEANKDHIPDPDNIAVGTKILIPELDARLIDSKNPRCIQKAKELHDLYVR